jgi:hypothetical protein
MSKTPDRTLYQPKFAVIKDRKSIAGMLVRIRYESLVRSNECATKIVNLDGVGRVVLRKRKNRQGTTKTMAFVNGKKIEPSRLLKAIGAGQSKGLRRVIGK